MIWDLHGWVQRDLPATDRNGESSSPDVPAGTGGTKVYGEVRNLLLNWFALFYRTRTDTITKRRTTAAVAVEVLRMTDTLCTLADRQLIETFLTAETRPAQTSLRHCAIHTSHSTTLCK